ncbi:hypothetical protein [Spirosoma pulveris]
MLIVLNRVFVRAFYARNAGTFLVILLLAFGFLSAVEHKALITAALGSSLLLGIVFVLWGLYLLKTVSFIQQELTVPEHLFLQTFWLIPSLTRWLLWLIIQVSLLLPIIAYGGWMIQIASVYQRWDSLIAIVLVLSGLTVTGVALADYRLRHPNPSSLRLPQVSIPLRYELFFPTYWLRHEPLSLVLTKAFSCLLLVGVCRLYPTDDYDQRLLLIGLLLAVLGHSQVGSQVSAFERKYLLLLQNLPFSRLQRLSRYTLMYGLIWMPELLVLLRNCPTEIRLDYVIWLWLTGWGWILLLHVLAYPQTIDPERWLSGVLAGFIGGLLAIMFGLPVGIWLIAGWLAALGVWFRSSKYDPQY